MNFSEKNFDVVERWKTNILINSEEFKNNYENMKILIEDLQKELKKSLFQGSEKSIEKHLKAGKLLGLDNIK